MFTHPPALKLLVLHGCFLLEVLQFGPATGPFDFQYVADEIFSSGRRGRHGQKWKNYIDDFFVLIIGQVLVDGRDYRGLWYVSGIASDLATLRGSSSGVSFKDFGQLSLLLSSTSPSPENCE